MDNWTDKFRGWLGQGRRALARLGASWQQQGQAKTGGAADAWTREFVEGIFRRYHFCEQAASWLRQQVRVQVLDPLSRNGGGFWIPAEGLVRLLTAQDEAAVHELAHAWWHYRRQGNERRLIEAVVRAANEPERPYARVQGLAHGYVHGTPHDGWPGLLVDNNDWEMFAGLASGTMGDVRLMPPYLRLFYEGLFEAPPHARA